MAAKKGVLEGLEALVEFVHHNALGLTLIGGAIIVTGGSTVYASRQIIELKGLVKFNEMKALKEIEAAKRETAEKFLTYGFTEEYANYQKLLKLKQAEERKD